MIAQLQVYNATSIEEDKPLCINITSLHKGNSE